MQQGTNPALEDRLHFQTVIFWDDMIPYWAKQSNFPFMCVKHYVSSTMCVEHYVCQALGVSSTICLKHYVCQALCVSSTMCVKHYVCQALCVSSTICVADLVEGLLPWSVLKWKSYC